MEKSLQEKSFKRRFEEFKRNKLIPYFKNYNNMFYYVSFLVLLAFLFFIYTIFSNGFTAMISGDYTYQSVPFFYNGRDDWWHFFTTGEFPFWDPNTAFGADNLANNSFYYVMDPFFLITTLFPRSFMPYVMLLTTMAKMIVGTLLFRILLKYFGVKETYARLFAICYGFGGWIIFYSWFAGFMETITFFPLVILGIEKVLKKEKPYILVLGLFLMGLSNFYFLIPVCFGGVIYSMFRYFQTWKTRKSYENITVLGFGILGFIIGLGSAAFLTLPSILNAMSYSRATTEYLTSLTTALSEGDIALFFERIFSWSAVDSSGYGFKAVYPLLSFLFPVTDGRNVPIMSFSGNRYDQIASSLFAYTPCIIIFFASLLKSIKEKKFSHLIAVGFWVFTLFVPFFYYFFHGMNTAYGRWEFLPFTFLVLYCAISFNKRKEYKKWMFDGAILISLLLMIVSVYLANMYHYEYPSRVEPIGDRWVVIAVSFGYIIILWYLFRKYYTNKKFLKYAPLFLAAELTLLGGYYSAFHGYTNYYSNGYLNGKDNVAHETKIFEHINEQDDDFFRVWSGRIVGSGTNIHMAENYNGTSYFHSEYNSNMDQFLHWSRVVTSYGNWTGNTIEKRPLLESFLGVKYYLTANVETNYKVIYDLKDTSNYKVYHVQPNVPFGYEKVNDGYSYGQYKLYKNTNFINFGYSFDTVVDPHIEEREDDNIRVFSDFYTYKYTQTSSEALVNDYNFMKAAVLETKDIEDIKLNYPGIFEKDLTEKNRLSFNELKVVRKDGNFSKTVYRLPYYFDPSDPLLYKTIGDTSNQGEELNPYTDIVVYEPTRGKTFNTVDDLENAFIFMAPLNKRNKFNIFLIDENGVAVTYDNFLQIDNYYKVFRTMYLKYPISQIIMVPMATSEEKLTVNSFPSYFYKYSYKDYMDIINEQKQFEFYDTYHSYNTFKFKTNYDKHRMIVLTVPYDHGWTCNMIDSNGVKTPLKVYKADGGFISVVGGVGEVSYEFNFKSYYFDAGLLIAFGSVASLALIFLYSTNKAKKSAKPKQKIIKIKR